MRENAIGKHRRDSHILFNMCRLIGFALRATMNEPIATTIPKVRLFLTGLTGFTRFSQCAGVLESS